MPDKAAAVPLCKPADRMSTSSHCSVTILTCGSCQKASGSAEVLPARTSPLWLNTQTPTFALHRVQ